jgi:hypothetical protein
LEAAAAVKAVLVVKAIEAVAVMTGMLDMVGQAQHGMAQRMRVVVEVLVVLMRMVKVGMLAPAGVALGLADTLTKALGMALEEDAVERRIQEAEQEVAPITTTLGQEDQVLLFLNTKEEPQLLEELLQPQTATRIILLLALGRLHHHESFCRS